MIPLVVCERAGVRRRREPITMGVPLPRGRVVDVRRLGLRSPEHEPVPLQTTVLARWPDRSVKWALLDFQADAAPHARAEYTLMAEESRARPDMAVEVRAIEGGLQIHTGPASYTVVDGELQAAHGIRSGERDLLDARASGWLLVDAAGHEYRPSVERIAPELTGQLRSTVRVDGVFARGDSALCAFVARLTFFAGHRITRLAFTVRNPRRARHPSNLWDLGDAGSIRVADLSLRLTLAGVGGVRTLWSAEAGLAFAATDEALEIYQDSSGGPNWDSRNHVNRDGRVTTVFSGYRLRCGPAEHHGTRAQPLVAVCAGEGGGLAATVQNFWQNFPKAVEVSRRTVVLRLFPRQSAEAAELQGGEQKTHVLHVAALDPRGHPADLEWTRAPLSALAPPAWYASTGAIPYLTARSDEPCADYLRLVDAAVDGDDTFERKREAIDEYGWRHFGDVYADHEQRHYRARGRVVSHYNNQYDIIYGAFVQLLRGGDTRWFRLMDELAAHVRDIDVYHTAHDRSAYRGGLFWHTLHYADAGTATHRSFSRRVTRHGGGPGNEHCYARGLLHHYFLTGEDESRATALGLARWIAEADDGRRSRLRWLDRGPTGRASATRSPSYHGPGRGAGNAIGALIDGFVAGGDRRFLETAEALIRRCVHPRDDVEARDLLDAERRWSYTMFFQSLGRYLDLKIELDELDGMYAHGRESLLRYARWMADHEVPYLSRAERLEFPTETWAAQDIRKSDVFWIAARHAVGRERARLVERADFFFHASVRQLTDAPTRTLARPVAIMMTCGHMQAYFRAFPDTASPSPPACPDFGAPQAFVPQRTRVARKLAWLVSAAAAVGLLVRAGRRRP